MKKEGIIFDLDGTLWEVTDRTYESVNKITKMHNLKEVTYETICSVFGLNKEEAARLYFPYLNIEESIKLIDEIAVININNLKEYGGNVYKNLEDVLKTMKKDYELFIVSNTGHKEYIEAFLISSKLGKYFTDYVAASELNITKAEGIRKIIKEYELDKYVYVGDTKKDLESTIEAKVPFIQAKYGYGKDLKTEYAIEEIKELPEIVEEIFNR